MEDFAQVFAFRADDKYDKRSCANIAQVLLAETGFDAAMDFTRRLGFGGSKDISTISQDQIRRFADAARLAVSPLWRLVRETAEQTAAAWKSPSEKEAVPAKLRTAIGAHIVKVATSIK